MPFSTRTLHDLAFADILAALAGRCRTGAGRERALVRAFLDRPEDVQAALSRVEEAGTLLRTEIALPLEGVADVRSSVERAAKGALLDPPELQACARTLFACLRTLSLIHI